MTDDDLTRLRAHRADVPPPSSDAWRDGRGALSGSIGRLCSKENDAFRDARPHSLRRLPRSRRWLVRAAIATVIAVVAVASAAALHPGSPASPPPANAQMVLAQLAAVAASQPPAHSTGEVASHSYRYIHVRGAASIDGRCRLLVQQNRETWVAPDRSGLEFEIDSNPKPVSSHPLAACSAELAAPWGHESVIASEERYGPHCAPSFRPLDPRKLPTNPATLRRKLETVDLQHGDPLGGPHGPGAAFQQIGELLRNTDASPALRAALYRVVARLSGVRSLGQVTDPAGRKGVALALVDHFWRYELIFDPNTAALLGDRETVAHAYANLSVGTVMSEYVYWPITIVHALPHRSAPAGSHVERFQWVRKDGWCQRAPLGSQR